MIFIIFIKRRFERFLIFGRFLFPSGIFFILLNLLNSYRNDMNIHAYIHIHVLPKFLATLSGSNVEGYDSKEIGYSTANSNYQLILSHSAIPDCSRNS